MGLLDERGLRIAQRSRVGSRDMEKWLRLENVRKFTAKVLLGGALCGTFVQSIDLELLATE